MAVGVWQLVLILVIVLILFGSGRLPQVMSDVGQGLKNLRRAVRGDCDENEGRARKEGVGGSASNSEKEGRD